MIRIRNLKDLKNHPLRNEIESYLKDEVPLKDVQTWIKEKGYGVSLVILGKMHKEMFKNVIDSVQEKSKKLVDELSKERLDLADSIEKSINQINVILDNTDMDNCTPQNAKELSTLYQAKANLTRAELEARGEAPKKNLMIMNLIEKKKKIENPKNEVLITS